MLQENGVDENTEELQKDINEFVKESGKKIPKSLIDKFRIERI